MWLILMEIMSMESLEFKSALIRLVFIINDGCSEGYVIRKAEELVSYMYLNNYSSLHRVSCLQ